MRKCLIILSHLVAADPDIKDIQRIEVVKEGEFLHVEIIAEVDPTHTVAYIDDVRDRLMDIILNQKGVRDVLISFDEDDGVETTWIRSNAPEATNNLIQNFRNKKKTSRMELTPA